MKAKSNKCNTIFDELIKLYKKIKNLLKFIKIKNKKK